MSRVTIDVPFLCEPWLLRLHLPAMLEAATAASALTMYSWKGLSLTKPMPSLLPVLLFVAKVVPDATKLANVGLLVELSI